MRLKFVNPLCNLLLILCGNTIYSLAVVMFILPNDLITGGTTGLSLTVNHYLDIPIPVFVFLFNCAMFLLGLAVLGRAFALTTLVSTFYFPFILGIFQRLPALSSFTDDPMLSTVCGGVMIGFGIGVVLRAGASTGGMDIPPLVLNRKLGVPVSVMLYVFDCTILLFQMLFSNKEQILYGILLVFIYTFVLDKTLLFGTGQTQVKIVSTHHKEINQAIIQTLDRGSTLLHARTGYLKEEQDVILTVISNRELAALRQLVMSIDPEAFMIIDRVNEVRGHGFSLQKKYH